MVILIGDKLYPLSLTNKMKRTKIEFEMHKKHKSKAATIKFVQTNISQFQTYEQPMHSISSGEEGQNEKELFCSFLALYLICISISILLVICLYSLELELELCMYCSSHKQCRMLPRSTSKTYLARAYCT